MATLRFTEGSAEPPAFAGTPGQLLPNIIDGLAQTRPGALYAMIPNSSTSYEDGYRKITYRQFASAINGASKLLSDELGPATTSETLAYIGPNDIGYCCFILGAVKTGHKLLLLSPRNTKSDHASLFQATKCTTLLTLPPPYSSAVTTILDGVQPRPRVLHVPTIYQLLEKSYAHFPYPKTFASAKDEALVIVHTSGTTSTPKVVTYTHAFAASHNRWSREPAPVGHINLQNEYQSQRVLTTYPFFHAGGIQIALLVAIPSQSIVVTSLAAVPPSIQGIADALKHVDVDAIYMVAPFVEQMAKEAQIRDFVLSRCTRVAFGGGDVSEEAAKAFQARVAIAGFNGSTESAPYPLIRAREGWDSADLKYIQLHPVVNMQFRTTGLPDLFEGIIVKNKDPLPLQPVFHIFPDMDEFRTSDLFSPHPHRRGLWLYRGRADDMIVSATGEMCNPVPFEQALSRRPEVAAALMVGTGRYQKALLVEPADSAIGREDLLHSISSAVESCNEMYPLVNRIERGHILLTEPDMPLMRAGKGTVQRAPSLELYRAQIDKLYETAGDGVDARHEPYAIHISAQELSGRRT